jgi:ceramide glucosyltransferase
MIPLGFTLVGVLYYLLCLWGAINFLLARRLARKRKAEGTLPGVSVSVSISILKPVHGTDPGAYENFRSHCLQDYDDYEIIFGVSDESDAAVPLVRQLMQEFPARSIHLMVCPQALGMNRKVSNLIQMLPKARHEILLVNDGDIQVKPDYLQRVAGQFCDAKVGMVTCLYHGIPGATLGSRLEALGISTEFSAGVLAARLIEGGIHFGLGSTLAFTRKALAAIGGLEPLLDYLADDYELGRRISAAGLQVRLADVNVETHLPSYTFREFFQHQLRWARSTRDSRRWGYAGLIFTFGLPWVVLTALFAHDAWWPLAWVGVTLAMRLLMALAVGVGVLHDRQVLRDLHLIPLRDFITVAVWAASFAGHKVAWRGTYFILENGKLRPAA